MRYFISDTSSPLTYLSCGKLISKQGFLHHRRNFDIDVLILVMEGILCISQNGNNREIGPNQYIFLRADEDHFGYKPSEGKLSYLWVHFQLKNQVNVIFKETFLDDILDRMVKDPDNNLFLLPVFGEISFTQRATLLFNQLLDLSRQEVIYSKQITDYALSLLIMEISQEFIEMHYKTKQNIPPNIARIMEWIKANYFKSITIPDIALEFGYNADYLSSLFKKITGNTLIYYINKTRIDISKSLIINYDLSLKETAYSCGFTDEKYFLKTFKKFENMTPSQYKKAFTRKMVNTPKS